MDKARTETSSDGRRTFKLTRRVGMGGFGEVYLAEMSTASGFTKTVALKMLRADVEGSGDNARRMRDEARMLGLLRHRAIVRADDLLTLDGRTAVVMEYIPGANLSDLLSDELFPFPLPANMGLEVIGELADALDAAWSRPSEVTGRPLQVLHRDIKPGNVRVTPDGEVKILDFGIARADKMERETATRDYAVGSLPYMAPELLVGQGASPASDMYALGVTFLEILCRSRFGIVQDTAEAHESRVESRIASIDLPELAPIRADLDRLVGRMMAFEAEERPTAREVADELNEIRHALHIPNLREWARDWIPKVRTVDTDDVQAELDRQDLSGRIFVEDQAIKIDVADTWDGDTIGQTAVDSARSDSVGEDKSWIWKTALIGLLGLVAILGYLLMQDEGPASEVVSSPSPSTTVETHSGTTLPVVDPEPDLSTPDPTLVDYENGNQVAETELVSGQEEAETVEMEIEENELIAEAEAEIPTPGPADSPSTENPSSEVTMVEVRIGSIFDRSFHEVRFVIRGDNLQDAVEDQTPETLNLPTGFFQLTCEHPQGEPFSDTIEVTENGGTWRCDCDAGRVVRLDTD